MKRPRLASLLHLAESDEIVTAYARPAAGPGWANQPLWVIVRDGNGRLREDCLQPADQPEFILVLYGIAAQVHSSLTSCLRLALERERG